MPRLNIASPLVARVTRPLVSDLLVINSASIHSLNVLAGMSGFARDRRSLLLRSCSALCLLSFSVLVSAQTPQPAPEAPAVAQNLHQKTPRPKLRAGKPEKPGAKERDV